MEVLLLIYIAKPCFRHAYFMKIGEKAWKKCPYDRCGCLTPPLYTPHSLHSHPAQGAVQTKINQGDIRGAETGLSNVCRERRIRTDG
ncbi:MAG TPA: hypothetical protein DGZ24_04135 [Rhodospirillaceae bacterium]|nr:hypothetical protein [Rhodospirillaceae bacterium]